MKGSHLKNLARTLRHNQTETEQKLWSLLRARELEGFKFRRQQPIGPYIADFCCLEKKLVIELDGGQHSTQQQKDENRTKILKREGFKVIRFWDNEIYENTDGVLETILKHLTIPPSPQPSPLKGEGVRERPSPQPSPLKGEGVRERPSPQPSTKARERFASCPLKGEGVREL